MTTSSKKQLPTVLDRYEIKRNGHVVYKVLSSDNVTKYNVTLVNGKAVGCECIATVKCGHKRAAEQKEAARNQPAQAIESEPVQVASPALVAASSSPVYTTAEQRKNAPLHSNTKGFNLFG